MNPMHIATHLHKVYIEGSAFVGMAQIDLPGVSLMTSEVKGGDISGAIDMPLVGLTQSMTATFNFRTVTKEIVKLLAGDRIQLECKIGIAVNEDGKHVIKKQKIVMAGYFKTQNTGKLAIGETQDRSYEMEVVYLKETFDDVETLEIDKLNTIHKVNGVDLLEEARAATE